MHIKAFCCDTTQQVSPAPRRRAGMRAEWDWEDHGGDWDRSLKILTYQSSCSISLMCRLHTYWAASQRHLKTLTRSASVSVGFPRWRMGSRAVSKFHYCPLYAQWTWTWYWLVSLYCRHVFKFDTHLKTWKRNVTVTWKSGKEMWYSPEPWKRNLETWKRRNGENAMYGSEFQIGMDRKPLLSSVFNKTKTVPQMASPRFMRWTVTLRA